MQKFKRLANAKGVKYNFNEKKKSELLQESGNNTSGDIIRSRTGIPTNLSVGKESGDNDMSIIDVDTKSDI